MVRRTVPCITQFLPPSLRACRRQAWQSHTLSPALLVFILFHFYPHSLSLYLTKYQIPATNYQRPECHCVYPCLINGTENRPLYPDFFLRHCELAEGKRGNHILYSPHSLSYDTFIYTRIFVFVFFPTIIPHLYLCF